jgi:hypothetical protein
MITNSILTVLTINIPEVIFRPPYNVLHNIYSALQISILNTWHLMNYFPAILLTSELSAVEPTTFSHITKLLCLPTARFNQFVLRPQIFENEIASSTWILPSENRNGHVERTRGPATMLHAFVLHSI